MTPCSARFERQQLHSPCGEMVQEALSSDAIALCISTSRDETDECPIAHSKPGAGVVPSAQALLYFFPACVLPCSSSLRLVAIAGVLFGTSPCATWCAHSFVISNVASLTFLFSFGRY